MSHVWIKPREPFPKGKGPVIVDEFTEMFPMWVCRVLITADEEAWAKRAAEVATGFATSIIGAPLEAGIEGIVSKDETPDGRPGAMLQMYHMDRVLLKGQLTSRLAQCVLTCPTTAAFDGLPEAKRRAKVGRSIAKFGDGFEVQDSLAGRIVWRIPVMEGEFIIEDSFGIKRGIAGGMFLILASERKAGLTAAEKAIEAIKSVRGVITPFPGGICRSGSKVGSEKYKLKASTNHPFCPTLRGKVANSLVPETVSTIYEIVINGLNLKAVGKALGKGIEAALEVPGIVGITSANYGGKLGPYRISLREALEALEEK
ncbi:MAG: formylmethanofuran--tetrahydromethanopterin N-formyltransferase [Candidatus Bathyarchaeia archaeon]